MMKTVQSLQDIYNLSASWKRQGLRVALVPTMGCLHQGHLSLMTMARRIADRVIVSIFVNPMQFGPNEDFSAYPRQLQIDCDLTSKQDIDAVFHPDAAEMYGQRFQTSVTVKSLSKGLCGGNRPGHFDGVATVVSKLFNLTNPDVALFGQKDFQQLAIIKQVVRDLNFPIEIVGCPIVREPDGLAMSSRNKYLEGAARRQALCLYNSIQAAKELVARSEQEVSAEEIIKITEKIVAEAGGNLEYAAVINELDLQPESFVTHSSVLAIAVKIANVVRLIDNSKLLFSTTQ